MGNGNEKTIIWNEFLISSGAPRCTTVCGGDAPSKVSPGALGAPGKPTRCSLKARGTCRRCYSFKCARAYQQDG